MSAFRSKRTSMKIGASTASPDRQFSEEDYNLSPASRRNISDGEKLLLPSTNVALVQRYFLGREGIYPADHETQLGQGQSRLR